MPRVEFVGQSAQDSDNIAANPSRLLNLYREPVVSEGRTRFVIKSVLGQQRKSGVSGAPVRAMAAADGANWVVQGGNLREVAADGTTTVRGAVADDANTTIAGNYGRVTVVADANYYVYDGSVSQPTGTTFSDIGAHCYVGGYTVLTEQNGRRFQWSSVGDAATLDALDFASADKVDDNIVRPVEFAGNLLLMCERSTEIWAIDPDAASNTSRFVYASMTNTGLKAFNLVVRFDDALFFVGNDNRAYLFRQGHVSTPVVETAIKQGTPTHCFYYEDEGHKFCVIRFSDRPAWVFDISTGEWHERSEGAGHVRWRLVSTVRNGADWLGGNVDGDIVELARTENDLGGFLYRRAVSRTLYLGDRKFTVPKVEILGRVGTDAITSQNVALAVGDGFALQVDTAPDAALLVESASIAPEGPSIALYESGDGGRTWRGPNERSMGLPGDYEQRMIWRARGQFQQYTMRVELTAPANLTLYADAFITAA